MNFTKEFEKLEKSQLKLSITVKQDEVHSSYSTLVNKYAKQLQIPGFRKGKVPVKVLEQKFGESLRAEASSELVEEVLKEIFEGADKYHRPLPYAQPELKDMPDFNPEADFAFTVVYDTLPEIALEKLDGYTISVPEVKVSDDDIQEELKALQEQNALVIDCTSDDPAAKDLIATVNLIELDDNDEEIAATKRNDFVFTIGSGQSNYDIDDDIIGMKKNDEKIITKTYPEDYSAEHLAGTTKKIRVTLTALKKRDIPAIDDDLAQDISEKYNTLDDLKAGISKKLMVKANSEIERQKVNSLLKQIVEANEFEIPESMVAAEFEGRWRMMAEQFRMTGEQLEQLTASMGNGTSKAEMLEQWRPDVELNLRTRLVVETLLAEKEITTTPEEVEAEYTEIAESNDVDIDEVKKYYENAHEKEHLIDSIKEKKLYKELFEKSTIKTTKKVSVKELFETEKEAADDGKNA